MILKNTTGLEISCPQVREELTNYLEADITPELRARIDWHLSGCASCRAYYDSVQGVIRILGETELIELPSGFSQRLRSRLGDL